MRDVLCYRKEDIVQRNFHYVIVDEADSILIDEARVPLILAGTSEDPDLDNTAMARLVLQLKADSDIAFDEYARSVIDKNLLFDGESINLEKVRVKEKIISKKWRNRTFSNETKSNKEKMIHKRGRNGGREG